MLEMPGGNRDGIGFLVGAARCHFDATLDATLSNPDGSDVVSSCQFLLTSALQSALRRLEKKLFCSATVGHLVLAPVAANDVALLLLILYLVDVTIVTCNMVDVTL